MSPEKLRHTDVLRVARDIEPSADVVECHKKIEEISINVFGPGGVIYPPKHTMSLDDELANLGGEFQRIPIPKLGLYGADSWRLPLLERRFPSTMNMDLLWNQAVKKQNFWLQAPHTILMF